jgi:hypothetical protein
VTNPLNADSSIVPSMPRLSTPARSISVSPIAASRIGVAMRSIAPNRTRIDSIASIYHPRRI